MKKLLVLPETSSSSLSIRAKALVFHDPLSLELLTDIERVARSEATVLVIGETGTGKELIARHIHATSGRRGPFIAVNCGAFNESLIDAELFGHETGAFTGASQSRAGWFETAHGGTLFLDEIGDLPMNLQVKLLRVLQERQVIRLGSRKSIPIDVRLVAATNIDLARAVEAQHFRADLYYRLSVATVRLPPLRERPADILPLAMHFIAFYRSKLNLNEVALSQEAQQLLLAYSWPGNIRELENVIHFALIVCHNDLIDAQDIRLVPLVSNQSLSGSVHTQTAPANPNTAVPPPPQLEIDPMEQLRHAWESLLSGQHKDLFDMVEALLVHTAFDHSGHNQVRTAKVLGMTRNTLRTLLKRHGLLMSQDAMQIEEATG